MKNIFQTFKVLFALVIALVLTITLPAVSTVDAKKPAEVIRWSNGFPSGPHFNLNIHGKDTSYTCDSAPGGGSVFVPEYDSLIAGYESSTIEIIQNKRSSISELTVHDRCAEAFDHTPIQVQLPKGTYQVYARVLAKPSKAGEPRRVSFTPRLVEACNDITNYDQNGDGIVDVADLQSVDIDGNGEVGDGSDNYDLNDDGIVDERDLDIWMSTFGGMIECTDSTLLGLGIVTGNGAFTKESQPLGRTKGKSKAVDVTDMFMYSGLIFDSSLDVDGDGDLDYDDFMATDINGDGAVDASEHDLDGMVGIDPADFEQWINMLEENSLVVDSRIDPMWIFDIADLVVYGWDYKNNGSKLVQIRFYPDDQTEYVLE